MRCAELERWPARGAAVVVKRAREWGRPLVHRRCACWACSTVPEKDRVCGAEIWRRRRAPEHPGECASEPEIANHRRDVEGRELLGQKRGEDRVGHGLRDVLQELDDFERLGNSAARLEDDLEAGLLVQRDRHKAPPTNGWLCAEYETLNCAARKEMRPFGPVAKSYGPAWP